MATYHNLATAEHEERQATYTHNPGEKYTESTGFRETVKYTGRWAALLAMAADAAANAGEAESVTADVERQGGDIAELRITRETFREPTADEDEEEEEPGEEEELGTENNPTRTSSSSLVQVSILAHPKFAGIGELERRALKAMIDGQDEHSLLDDDASATGTKRICDCITSDAAQVAKEYIGKGVFYWNDVATEATLRWKGRSNRYEAGEISGSLPGIAAGAGRNWLCSGTGTEKNGSEVWQTASFRLSGPGGWDPFLYESASGL